MRRRTRVAIVVATALVLLAVALFRLSPMWPGPALPAGATRLHITTEGPHLLPSLGCAGVGLAPLRVAISGDELVLARVDTGAPVAVVWPTGWAAWQRGGRAELVTRGGEVRAREGDVLTDLGGCGGTGDGFFHVADTGS